MEAYKNATHNEIKCFNKIGKQIYLIKTKFGLQTYHILLVLFLLAFTMSLFSSFICSSFLCCFFCFFLYSLSVLFPKEYAFPLILINSFLFGERPLMTSHVFWLFLTYLPMYPCPIWSHWKKLPI